MRSAIPCVLLVSALACSLFALPAQAKPARVYVSVSGNDSNPCSETSPCRTFTAAQNAVEAGGEIAVLHTGGYDPVTITKALSIVAVGVEATIASTKGITAITINAGANDKVALRGLTLDGANLAAVGIQFNSGASLTVEDCGVRNMTSNGLAFTPSATTGTQALVVANSYFNDNGSDGIQIAPSSSGAVTAAIDRTGLNGNDVGLNVFGQSSTGAISVAVTDSVAANNGTEGFSIQSTRSSSLSNLSLTRALAEGNHIGIFSSGINAAAWLAQSTLTGNAISFDADHGGVVDSYGDNYIDMSNGAPIGTLTTVGKE